MWAVLCLHAAGFGQYIASNGLRINTDGNIMADMGGGAANVVTSWGFPLDSSGNLMVDCILGCGFSNNGTTLSTTEALSAGATSVTSFTNSNDQGPGGLTWCLGSALGGCNGLNANLHVSQYGEDVYMWPNAATVGIISGGYNSATLGNFTAHTVAVRLDQTFSDATTLASLEVGPSSVNKVDIYPYNGVLYSIAWDSVNNLNSCGTGFAYLVQGGGLSCSAPTLVYQPSTMRVLRVCLGCNLNGVARTATTWYTDYSPDGLADSTASHWISYGSIAKASLAWSSTSGVLVYFGVEPVTTTPTYPGYAQFGCFSVDNQGGCGGAPPAPIGYNSGSISASVGSTVVANVAQFPKGQYLLACDVVVTAVGSSPTLATTIGWTDISGTARTKTCTTGVVAISDNSVTQTITSNGTANITVTQTLAVSTATWQTTVSVLKLQ
jgi:hypothetical protein